MRRRLTAIARTHCLLVCATQLTAAGGDQCTATNASARRSHNRCDRSDRHEDMGHAAERHNNPCGPWAPAPDGAWVDGVGSAVVSKPGPNGETLHLYFRACPGGAQTIWVGPTSPRDIASAAYDEVRKRLPKPEPLFAGRLDYQIVNLETWFGATPIPPQSVDASVPGAWTTVTATPVNLTLDTGSIVAGDTTHIECQPWGSADAPVGGCSWTPIWPSVLKTTGTNDHRYHATLSVDWDITWTSSTGAGGTLDTLTTTSPLLIGVGEIQVIGGT